MSLRIVFLCDEYPPFRNGGIGTYTKEVAERLVSRGHKVTVIGIFPDVPRDTATVYNGVEICQLAPSKVPVIGNRLRVFRAVKEQAHRVGIDILETQENSGFLAGWPKTDFKIIVRLHGSITNISDALGTKGWKTWVWKVLEGRTLQRADHIVSVSRYTAERTQEIFGLRREMEVIYNGVTLPDCRLPNQASAPPVKVVFAGSLLPMKGFKVLIRAWAQVQAVVPGAQLHIAGKDPCGIMDQIGETLADTSTVTYHGILTKADLEALYAASHLAVFPSFIEAFSLAPMEAMAVGLPVIFTERASGRELITEGETGRLVDPGDVEGVASTLIEMIQMPAEARHALALRGQKHIQDNFSIDRLIDENEALMYRLLGRIPAG